MVTEQNILEADMSRKKKGKRKENYRPYSRAVGGGEGEKETIVRTAEEAYGERHGCRAK
jgi:hypothetical protein